jgi:hypothetical protein
MLRYADPKNKSGWIKELKKELNTIVDSGTLNNKEQTKPNDIVVSTTEANKTNLEQDGNLKCSRCEFV